VLRVLAWNPSQRLFFRAVDRISSPMLC